MSNVKFKEETITSKVTETGGAALKSGKHEGLAHEIGEKLTAGGGANGYLAVRQIVALAGEKLLTDARRT
jgi:hypothetical protein